ncbi:MAG TPA: hypothetical protein DDZ51_06170 [Planctomycetaceae bacterium]|nr:hypothetical protein [Planctomycetaceae bacterium]
MTALREWISVSENEKPFIHFESSLDDDQVVAGYVPVKSTLDVLSFLKDATATHASQGRAVICHGSYGSGKSRLCAVLARLFRDGFDSESLQPVWERLNARGEGQRLDSLRKTMVPGGGTWRPWLVVSVYEAGQGGSISNCLINAIFKAVKRVGLDESVLGETIHRAAAARLEEMVANGATYVPPTASPYSSVEQLKRALVEDSADDALDTFRDFYRTTTYGTEFDEWVRNSGGISLEAHDVFCTVAERIQAFGYEGIIVIWDEFGFFIEEMLRGSDQGTRSLGREAMSLQNFVERACSNSQLGRKVVFLGFTHVSLSEYGSRQGLGDADRDRLSTVSDRFRDPSIPIQLSVTENEGYHLLSGMIHRTEEGKRIFANPIPKLQHLATKMMEHSLWLRLGSDQSCYNEIVAPCYPLHPATSSALLLLSDQVAQRARTTFYYLQNRENGGLASLLEKRRVENVMNIGSQELIRINDIFAFFREAIRETKRQVLDQYEEAVARFPGANEFEIRVLQTTLVLSVIATPAMAPTTNFLSLCLCDSTENEATARPLHEALKRLNDASSLWKNEATNVWGFVGSQGLTTGLDDDLDAEKALIPATKGAAELLRESIDVQREIIDLIGDFDLDPAASGIVRRVGINLLPAEDSDLERILANHPVNPARDSCSEPWRSARVFLLATDSEPELASWRQAITQIAAPNYYFVVPRGPLGIDRELVRELMAARNLLEKTGPGTHAYEVLEGRLTRLRTELTTRFGKSFGNEGLGAGTTVVVRGGASETTLPISSWNELLPAISVDLDNSFTSQIRVRCGTFNEWRTGQSLSAIEKIVKRILRFNDTPDWQSAFLNFALNSQEAAIIDGVLVENMLFKEDPLTKEWSLATVDSDTKIEALLETLRFFQKGGSGDKEIAKLFSRLINPPFGIPNGIIPLLIALVARSEGSRIVFYAGPQSQRVTDAQLSKAIADMGKQPTQYRARYNKLSNKQRLVFCAVGPEVGINFTDKVLRGEAFYEQAEMVRAKLRDWIAHLPEVAVQSKTLTDSQRHLTRLLRQPIPPQLSLLADCLIEFFSENSDALEELHGADSKTQKFSAMSKHWGDYRLAIERYVDGVRAPLHKIIRELTGTETAEDERAPSMVTEAIGFARGQFGEDSIFGRTYENLVREGGPEKTIEDVIGVITSKRPENLTEEDYGKAAGFLEITAEIQKGEVSRRERQEFEVAEPNGNRNRFIRVENLEASKWIEAKLHEFAQLFSLSSETAKAIAIETVCNVDIPSCSVADQKDEPSLSLLNADELSNLDND